MAFRCNNCKARMAPSWSNTVADTMYSGIGNTRIMKPPTIWKCTSCGITSDTTILLVLFGLRYNKQITGKSISWQHFEAISRNDVLDGLLRPDYRTMKSGSL